jgi:hypothetical protein
MFNAVLNIMDQYSVTVTDTDTVAIQPFLKAFCNLAYMMMGELDMSNSYMLDVFQAFKFHLDFTPTDADIQSASIIEDRSIVVLVYRLYDYYLFHTYKEIYEDAKQFCETNETNEDDTLGNSCCLICHQSDSPQSSFQCSSEICNVIYHYECYNHDRGGFDLNIEWFCTKTCFDTFVTMEEKEEEDKKNNKNKRKRQENVVLMKP